jgi:ElaB/YqjD/DUF883 family membrane-anchored ribosome-binding protein
MTSRIEAATDGSTEKLLHELKTIVKEAEGLLASGASELNGNGEEAVGRLGAALETAKATYLKVQEKTIAGAKRTDTLIRENPYSSMGVALGIGVLVGYLVARKKSD